MVDESASGIDVPRRYRDRRSFSDQGLLVFTVLAFPAVVFYLGLSSSYAFGMTLVALFLLLRRWNTASFVFGIRPIRRNSVLGVTLAVIFVVVFHLLIVSMFQPVDAIRAMLSILLLTLLCLASAALANSLLSVPERLLHRGLRRVFYVMCALGLVGSWGWGPPTFADEAWRKPVFPFSEPSHFALAFVPGFMYACVTARGVTRVAFLILGITCSILIQNLTLLIGVILVAIVSLRISILFGFLALLLVGSTQIDLSYYEERVDLSGDSRNLSKFVYLQGWQMIGEALERSAGIGIGFQQLGINGTDVEAAAFLRAVRNGEDMNLLDGGFVFAKIGGEFGLFGIALAVFFLALMVRSVWTLRSAAIDQKSVPRVRIFAYCVVVTFVIELFIRGTGYFTGTGLMFAAALWILGTAGIRTSSIGRGREAAGKLQWI